MNSLFNGKRASKIYDGRKAARLGTDKNPAVVRVPTKKRAKEVESIFKKNGWKYKIELGRGKSEDIAALEILMNPVKTMLSEKKVGRNDPCPCGSGKKFKRCCG